MVIFDNIKLLGMSVGFSVLSLLPKDTSGQVACPMSPDYTPDEAPELTKGVRIGAGVGYKHLFHAAAYQEPAAQVSLEARKYLGYLNGTNGWGAGYVSGMLTVPLKGAPTHDPTLDNRGVSKYILSLRAGGNLFVGSGGLDGSIGIGRVFAEKASVNNGPAEKTSFWVPNLDVGMSWAAPLNEKGGAIGLRIGIGADWLKSLKPSGSPDGGTVTESAQTYVKGTVFVSF